MVHNLPENFNISDFDVFHSALVHRHCTVYTVHSTCGCGFKVFFYSLLYSECGVDRSCAGWVVGLLEMCLTSA